MDFNYYDKVLAGISISLASGAVLGISTVVPIQYAVGGGAAVSIGIMYHGMFKNAPER